MLLLWCILWLCKSKSSFFLFLNSTPFASFPDFTVIVSIFETQTTLDSFHWINVKYTFKKDVHCGFKRWTQESKTICVFLCRILLSSFQAGFMLVKGLRFFSGNLYVGEVSLNLDYILNTYPFFYYYYYLVNVIVTIIIVLLKSYMAYQLEVPICPPSWMQFGNNADYKILSPWKYH